MAAWQGVRMAETTAPPGRLSGDQISEMDLPDWRSIHEALQTRFRTGDFATGLKLVAGIGAVAEELNHHPDLDLRYNHLNVRLMSHDVWAKTARDVELARRISALAASMGVPAEPSVVSRLEIGLDTWNADEIRPFWLAVLGLQCTRGSPTTWSMPTETLRHCGFSTANRTLSRRSGFTWTCGYPPRSPASASRPALPPAGP